VFVYAILPHLISGLDSALAYEIGPAVRTDNAQILEEQRYGYFGE